MGVKLTKRLLSSILSDTGFKVYFKQFRQFIVLITMIDLLLNTKLTRDFSQTREISILFVVINTTNYHAVFNSLFL
jgi:hypothetical protein